jgi:hypothetical protein
MTEISDSQLNTMLQVLFEMRSLSPNLQNPTFTVAEIVQEWQTTIDDSSTTVIEAILQQGASTGLFLFAQDISGVLSYGFNRNAIAINPRNKQILLASGSVCLDPCNQPNRYCCGQIPAVRSDCCFTQWKGTVAGGSIGTQCGVSMETALFLCSGQQTRFCGLKNNVASTPRTAIQPAGFRPITPSLVSGRCVVSEV